MSEYIKLEDAMKIAELHGYVTPDDLLSIGARSLIYCKDCKHKGWVQEPCHGKSINYCRIWDCALQNPKKIFCSYGERKDGDEYLHSIQRSKECD